jgi:flavin-dependent dehydrogenase
VSADRWDVVVVGAGPAGSVAALGASRAGLRTLLVDRERLPRWKVCGACLNGAALEALSWAGLGSLAERSGVGPLHTLALRGWGRNASVPITGSVALSRKRMDQALVEAAVDEGVTFRVARVGDAGRLESGGRRLRLHGAASGEEVVARVVVVATGLASLRHPPGCAAPARVVTAAGSRVGVGGVLPPEAPGFAAGTIHMVVGRPGYVGLVRQEDGSLNVAGALDPRWVRTHGGPEGAVRAHLGAEGVSLNITEPVHGWRGTPLLTRTISPLAGARLFRVGDAAGYVEPFTGEGMAWAMAGGRMLAPLLQAASRRWDPSLARRWEELHRRSVGRRQRLCRMVAWTSRHPTSARAALSMLEALPRLAGALARRNARPFPDPLSGAMVP